GCHAVSTVANRRRPEEIRWLHSWRPARETNCGFSRFHHDATHVFRRDLSYADSGAAKPSQPGTERADDHSTIFRRHESVDHCWRDARYHAPGGNTSNSAALRRLFA